MNTTKKLHVTSPCLQEFCYNLKKLTNDGLFVICISIIFKVYPFLRRNSPYCLPDNSHDVPLENLVLDQLIIFHFSHPLSA